MLARADPVSDTGWASGRTDLGKGEKKTPAVLPPLGEWSKNQRNNPTDTKEEVYVFQVL